MYGAYWCPHCADQKEMFESSFQYIPYVECGMPGSRDEAQVCIDAGIKHFPTWEFADGERREGAQSLAVARRQDRMHPAMMLPATPRFAAAHSPVDCGAGIGWRVVSSVSLYHHYGTSATSYCDFGENFNCDIVNRSMYSTDCRHSGGADRHSRISRRADAGDSLSRPGRDAGNAADRFVAGLGFALYLTYIEGFVLATWCILCLSSLTLISSIAVLSWCYGCMRPAD